jgi:predicted exporter
MSELSTDVRVFLSSTFTDLRDLRREIANRLSEVFGARLIIMETFGSDEAPPEISSVRKVRESDVFVAVYTEIRTLGRRISSTF